MDTLSRNVRRNVTSRPVINVTWRLAAVACVTLGLVSSAAPRARAAVPAAETRWTANTGQAAPTTEAFQRTDWRTLPPGQLRQLVAILALAYGLEPPKENEVRDLVDVYHEFVRRVPPRERAETVVAVARRVQHGLGSAEALLPFIHHDPAAAVVSTSALHLATLVPLRDDDLLTGPRYVCGLAETVTDDGKRGQIVAGLLLLGDRRLTPVVRACSRTLGPAGRRELSSLWSGFAYRSHVDFLLEWLEDPGAREGEFGIVAGTLARVALHAQPREVLDVERRFPAGATPDGPNVRVLRRWSIRDYGQAIGSRLRALAQREREPKVVPLVMEAWGVE